MSEVMTHGIIGMPYDLAMGDELSRRQFHSRAQELLADYAALESENARLRAGQEPVAVVKESQYLLGDTSDEISELLPIGTKLYATPATAQGGVYSTDPLACSGCVSGCFRCRSATAQGVNQQLLEALEKILQAPPRWYGRMVVSEEDEVQARAAIAAARKGEGK